MIRNYYKFHGMIGIAFVAITFFLVAMNFQECQEGYYWVLYNRVYFSSIYLPLFLCGVLPVCADMFREEAMVRYGSRQEIWEKLISSLFFYIIFYSCLFCIANSIMMNLFGGKTEVSAVQFIIPAFFCQGIGWFLIGSFYSCIYLMIRHVAGAWGVTLLCFLAITSLAEEYGTKMMAVILSPYHLMYQFMLEKQLIWLLIRFLGEIAGTIIFLTIGFLLFRASDIKGDKRGE